MKYILLSLFLICNILYSKNICINNNNPDINITYKEFIKLKKNYKEFSNVKFSDFKNMISKEINFIKNIKKEKKYKFNNSDEIYLKIKFLNALADVYVNKLKNNIHLNDKILKSYFYDHINNYHTVVLITGKYIIFNNISDADLFYKKISNIKNKNYDDYMKQIKNLKIKKMKNIPLDEFQYNVRIWFEKAKNGDVSKPIKIGKKYFIFIIDKKTIKKPLYNNYKQQIKNYLLNIKLQQVIDQLSKAKYVK